MLLDGDEGFCIDRFELYFRFVLNLTIEQRHLILAGAFDRVGDQYLRSGQGMVSTCADLAKYEVLVLQSDPVTIGGNVDVESVVLALVQTAIAKLEQFWMKRSAKQVEAEVGNFWSNR